MNVVGYLDLMLCLVKVELFRLKKYCFFVKDLRFL